jgi:hypothetical protein
MVLCILGFIIRWLRYFDLSQDKIEKKGELFLLKTFIKNNSLLFIYSLISTIILNHSLPDLFIKINCLPCNNELTSIAIGYMNFDLIKELNNFIKTKIKNEAD